MHRIRGPGPAGCDMLTIARTGYVFDEDIRRAGQAVIDAHLAKPVVFDQRKREILRLLGAPAA